MSGYLVALMEPHDEAVHWRDTEYGPTFWRLLERHGGEMVAGGAMDQVEGVPLDESTAALFRFPTTEAARAFWNDPEYQAVVPLRRPLGTFQIFVLPGWPEQ